MMMAYVGRASPSTRASWESAPALEKEKVKISPKKKEKSRPFCGVHSQGFREAGGRRAEGLRRWNHGTFSPSARDPSRPTS